MKYIYSKIIVCLLGITLIIGGCTRDFEEYNTNPYGVSDQSLEQDFNIIGAFIPAVTRMIVNTTHYRYQIAQNLCSDSWACYLAPPTPFYDGVNNTTYYMRWKDHTWNSSYEGIMAPSKDLIAKSKARGQKQFIAWINLIKIYGMQRVASLHGPIIYSQYGESATYSKYDKEAFLYKYFFNELDEIVKTLKDYENYEGFKRFDATTYNGDVKKWIKLANTLRLQLAIRISKIDPVLAQQEAEKATENSTSYPFGVIMDNSENFEIDLGTDAHPLFTISYSWNDTRMSADMESILVGYKDARIEKMFAPVEKKLESSLVSNHLDYPYKGIRNGAYLDAKSTRVPFSKVGAFVKDARTYTVLNASQVSFMLAEAKLRGWNVGSKTPQQYYEDGITLSFLQWGASNVSKYINNSTNLPIDYTDPKESKNNFTTKITIPVAWNNSDSQEVKLEKIITQKWIAGFPDSYMAWVDFRRTGYPKLSGVARNESETAGGIIPDGEHIRRMKFVDSEYENNKQGVEEAIKDLGGKDEIGTRLWWDVDKPNF